MRNRALRPLAAILSFLLLGGSPAKAGPVAIHEVIQVLGSYQSPSGLQLRAASQYSAGVASGVRGPAQYGIAKQSASGNSIEIATTLSGPTSLLSGVTDKVRQDIGVQVIDQGDVEGTVCDCGEIIVPGGGFPKWPLLFLAAIPFFFIHGCDNCDTPNPTPTPPQPQPPTIPGTPQIPEPGSMLLFGTGLAAFGANLRRRYTRGKLAARIQATEGD